LDTVVCPREVNKEVYRADEEAAVVRNGTLFINGGLETFVDLGANGQADWSTITTGISTSADLILANE